MIDETIYLLAEAFAAQEPGRKWDVEKIANAAINLIIGLLKLSKSAGPVKLSTSASTRNTLQ